MASGPRCPKCGAVLKDDYGMVTCAQCETILFVDMEGIAHIGTAAESDQPLTIEPVGDEPANVHPEEPIVEPASWEYAAESVETAEPGLEQMIPVESPSPPWAPEPSEPELAPAPDFNMDSLLGYGEPVSSEAQAVAEPTEFVGSPGDPLGVNEFANSTLSQAIDGMLVFRLAISGIDSKEIKESLREALEDSRFAWDAGELLSRINKGKLVIENLSPVKTTIVVNRIKRLPVEIHWEQYAITQMEDDQSG